MMHSLSFEFDLCHICRHARLRFISREPRHCLLRTALGIKAEIANQINGWFQYIFHSENLDKLNFHFTDVLLDDIIGAIQPFHYPPSYFQTVFISLLMTQNDRYDI